VSAIATGAMLMLKPTMALLVTSKPNALENSFTPLPSPTAEMGFAFPAQVQK